MIKWIKKIFTKCDHDWRPKGNPMNTSWFYYHQYRCVKCKKIKEINIQK